MGDTDSEVEVFIPPKCRKMIMLCKLHMADSTVTSRITWPHELVYTVGDQPAVYEQLTFPFFMTGYLAVVDTVKSGLKKAMLKHLHELMADAANYRWEPVHAYQSCSMDSAASKWMDRYGGC